MSDRCEGWRRHGGAFRLGSVEWKQCESDAIVMLTVEQEKVEDMPACKVCWAEGIERGIKILKVIPIDELEAVTE